MREDTIAAARFGGSATSAHHVRDNRNASQSEMIQKIDWSQRLYYLKRGVWTPLPHWARFFIRFGSAIAMAESSQSRVIAAISIPTRAYAASLCGTGIVLERASLSAEVDQEHYLGMLRALPIGATVRFRTGSDNGAVGWGTLRGIVTDRGREYVEIQDSRSSIYKTPVERTYAVEPVTKDQRELPLKPRHKKFTSPLGLAAAISTSGINDFGTRSHLDCLLIGNATVLEDEIMTTTFEGRDDEGKGHGGVLQSLLRVREFGGSGQPYRSRIVSSSSKPNSAATHDTPSVVIFDGSRSFLRWAPIWPAANWVVILDRTDRMFSDAVSRFDTEYAERIETSEVFNFPAPPGGIQFAAFGTRRGLR